MGKSLIQASSKLCCLWTERQSQPIEVSLKQARFVPKEESNLSQKCGTLAQIQFEIDHEVDQCELKQKCWGKGRMEEQGILGVVVGVMDERACSSKFAHHEVQIGQLIQGRWRI